MLVRHYDDKKMTLNGDWRQPKGFMKPGGRRFGLSAKVYIRFVHD